MTATSMYALSLDNKKVNTEDFLLEINNRLKSNTLISIKTVRRQYLVNINISNSVNTQTSPLLPLSQLELEDQQISKISSRELSERMHLTASQ